MPAASLDGVEGVEITVRLTPRAGENKIAGERDYLKFTRFDNGPEIVAHAVADRCRFNGTETLFIDPGSAWQNAWIESFNGPIRDE